MRTFKLILAAAVAILAGCSGMSTSGGGDPSAGFRAYEDQFVKDMLAFYPEFAIQQGEYSHADQVTIPDDAQRDHEIAFLDAQAKALAKFDPAQLEPSLRGDYVQIDNYLKSTRWHNANLRDWEWDPSQYNVANALDPLLSTEYAPLDQRLRTVSARLDKVPAFYAAAQKSIHHPTREHTQLAIKQNAGVLQLLGDDLAAKVKSSGLTDAEKATFDTRMRAAREAVDGYVKFLADLEPNLTPDYARSFRLGPQLYEKKFQFDIQSSFTAEELYKRAIAAKERLLVDMEARSKQLWPKYFTTGKGKKAKVAPMPTNRHDLIAAVVAKVSEQHSTPASFEGDVRALVPQLEKFVRDHDLVDQDPTKPLQVRPTPPYNPIRGVAIASIDAPGPFNSGAATYFNVNPMSDFTPERQEGFLREYNKYMMQIFTIHEAVPGHYVQLLHANKSPSVVKSLLSSGPMVEGWAVYSERMMVEQGWGDNSPEIWLMLDKFQLRSTCNTILDYSVHVKDLSEEGALMLLEQDAFQTETEARGKWRRVQLTSVQLTSYFAGFSEIYEFREAQKTALGDKFNLRDFHNQFLSYGSVPVKTIKALMTEPQMKVAPGK